MWFSCMLYIDLELEDWKNFRERIFLGKNLLRSSYKKQTTFKA